MADKPSKPQKLKARLPRGLADRGPAEIAATRHMVEAIRVVFERYGFEPVETPAIEYTDALGKFLPDQDRPNEGVFSFQDDDEQWLSLRYDLTAPLARYVAENFQNSGIAIPLVPFRLGVPQRKAGSGTLPTVHAVRCGYCWRCLHGSRCRDVHARRGHDGSARHSARQLRREGEQPQGSRWCDGPRSHPGGKTTHDDARHRQARSARNRRRQNAARQGTQGRKRRLYKRRRAFGFADCRHRRGHHRNSGSSRRRRNSRRRRTFGNRHA